MNDINGKEINAGDFIEITEGTMKVKGFVYLIQGLNYLAVCAEGFNYRSLSELIKMGCTFEILPMQEFNPEPIRRYLEQVNAVNFFDGQLNLDKMMLVLCPVESNTIVLGVATSVEDAKKIVEIEVKNILEDTQTKANEIFRV